MRRVISKIAQTTDIVINKKGFEVYLVLIAFVWFVSFNLIFFNLNIDTNTVLDPDLHGVLGLNLAKFNTFTFDHLQGPTLNRGPVYPVIISILYTIGKQNWFYLLIAFQSLLAALTVYLGYKSAKLLFNNQTAIFTAILLNFNPFILRYSGLVMLETMAIFLMASIMYLCILAYRENRLRFIPLLGITVALAALHKSTFLIYIPLIFIGLLIIKRYTRAFLFFFVSVCIIMPWTVRNARISGNFIPVHLLGGYNMYRGNQFAKEYTKDPFSYLGLWQLTSPASDSLEATIDSSLTGWKREVASDSLFMNAAITELSPGFLVQKVAYNSILFWTAFQSTRKSIFMFIIRIPLFLLLIYSVATIIRKRENLLFLLMPLSLALFYYFAHLPLFATGRFSAVLVPIMVVYSGHGLWCLIFRHQE